MSVCEFGRPPRLNLSCLSGLRSGSIAEGRFRIGLSTGFSGLGSGGVGVDAAAGFFKQAFDLMIKPRSLKMRLRSLYMSPLSILPLQSFSAIPMLISIAASMPHSV
eukprot:15248499-Alexandrium_andersonii.AAC.1